MHLLLLDRSPKLDRASLIGFAKELKLDVPRFTKDLDTERHKKEIDRDLKLGEALDLYNTPTIFINGVKLLGTADRGVQGGHRQGAQGRRGGGEETVSFRARAALLLWALLTGAVLVPSLSFAAEPLSPSPLAPLPPPPSPRRIRPPRRRSRSERSCSSTGASRGTGR